jgi:hypothetical protein
LQCIGGGRVGGNGDGNGGGNGNGNGEVNGSGGSAEIARPVQHRQATPDRTASQRRPARVAVAGISAAGLVGTGYCKS